MAIRRCPYCKAIIDEQDKYCNNCGTQLLFPEDEFVDEEIPGDRIVEEPEEEKKEAEVLEGREKPEEPEPTEEGLEEKEQGEEEEGKEEDEEEDEEEGEETEDLEEAEEEEEEEEKEEEAEEEEEEREEETAEEFGLEAAEGEPEEEEEDIEEIESPTGEIGTGEPALKQAQVDDSHRKYKVSIEEDELVFKTKELEGLTDTVEEGKEKVKEFLSSFEKEKAKAVAPEVPPLFAEKDWKAPTTMVLPPWAKGMKEEPAQPDDFEKSREKLTETEAEPGTTPTRPDWATDSGIGIPEKITQAGLSFGTAAVPATAEVREAGAEEEEEEARAVGRQRSRLRLKLRSKLVDLVFITALWVISLWFTAQVIGVTFFRLIVGSPVPVLAFYFILLLLYFFLFLYFLGETLGDHFFSLED